MVSVESTRLLEYEQQFTELNHLEASLLAYFFLIKLIFGCTEFSLSVHSAF